MQDISEISDQSGLSGPVVAEDLDADGDVDLLLSRFNGGPDLYENDGTGHFLAHASLPAGSDWRLPAAATVVADLDGDGLAEVLVSGLGMLAAYANLGDLNFAPSQLLWWDESEVPVGILGPGIGDIDGDGALDILLPAAGFLGKEAPRPPHRVLFQRDLHITPGPELESGSSAITLLSYVLDQDSDGDADLLLPADEFEPSRYFIQQPDGQFQEAFQDRCCVVKLAAMGIETADLNGDGWIDFCITTIGSPQCFLSDGPDAMYEGAQALGFTEAETGWSFVIEDLDNDGFLEAMQTSAFHGLTEDGSEHHDLLWWGQPDNTFVNVSEETGFGEAARHRGMVVADLDGNGSQDIVRAEGGSVPLVWMNQCSSHAWVDVRLEQDQPNRSAVGAKVTIEANNQRWTREVRGPRGLSQTPAQVHFGLGEATEITRLQVTWPDGETTVLTNQDVSKSILITR